MQKPAKTLSSDYFDYILKINTEEQVLTGICPLSNQVTVKNYIGIKVHF